MSADSADPQNTHLHVASDEASAGGPTDEHVRRMNRVLDHIDAHLADDLRLDALAEVASFSPFHFHRMFRAWTGETLLDFTRRRRLESAGGRLHHSKHERVTAIALDVGFASAEAFARAFKQHFGLTPSQWRHQGPPMGWAPRGATERPEGPVLAAPDLPPLSVQVKTWPAREVLYLRLRGPYESVVMQAWDRFIPWVASMGLAGQPLIGMGLDDPHIAPASQCRFDACVVLPEGFHEPALRASRKWLEGGTHACLAYDGPQSGIGHAWRRLLCRWLPGSGYQVNDRPFFEAYADAARPTAQRMACELCMPVERARAV